MKIVVDIPENYYNACKRLQKQGIAQVAEAIIANGKPYEERPQGEWIPVSERLPECMDNVLVTIQVGNRKPVVRSGYYAYGLFNIDNGDVWNWNDTEVKAWMPQPVPYEEVENE